MGTNAVIAAAATYAVVYVYWDNVDYFDITKTMRDEVM
eukprot:gene9830-27101_t